jgi:hypothetical protein
MAVITFNAFDFVPVMAVCTVLQESLSVSLTGRVAVGAFQTAPPHMGLVGKFNVIKRNDPFLDAHMAKGCAGHPGLKFSGGITFLNGGQGLLSLTIRRIEKFEGVFDIMNALAKKDEAVIVASFIE